MDAHAVAAVYDGLVRSGFLEDDVKQALQVPCGGHTSVSRSTLLLAVFVLQLSASGCVRGRTQTAMRAHFAVASPAADRQRTEMHPWA